MFRAFFRGNARNIVYLLQNIKNKFAQRNGWTEFSFINSLPVAANKINSGSNIILLDDFIGTGYTIVRKYRWLLKVLEKLREKVN